MGMRDIKGISDVMNGAVGERFDDALQKALQDIQDLNKNPEAVRTVTLKVKIKSSLARDGARFAYEVGYSAAPNIPLVQTVLTDRRDDGTVDVYERGREVPGQVDMGGNVMPLPARVSFGGAKDAATGGVEETKE